MEADCLNAVSLTEAGGEAAVLAADQTSVASNMAGQLVEASMDAQRKQQAQQARDRSLSPIHLAELRDALQILPNQTGYRCSDRGFLNMTSREYIELLDWTARCIAPDKRGATPEDAPPIFERLLVCRVFQEGGWQAVLIFSVHSSLVLANSVQ